MKIWIYGLNERHYLDDESDIAIYKSLKISEQNIEAPISGFLQIYNLNLVPFSNRNETRNFYFSRFWKNKFWIYTLSLLRFCFFEIGKNKNEWFEVASVIFSVISFASGATLRKSSDTKNYMGWKLKLVMFLYIASDYFLATVFVTVHHFGFNPV